MRKIKIAILFLGLFLLPITALAQNISDYLILQTIGQYHSSGKGRCGEGSGIIGTSDHFDEDHNVITCRTGYYFTAQDLAVSIKVEQHTGVDSDRWLLHEIEDAYRNGDDEDGRLGLLSGAGVKIREIDGNKIIYWGLGGGNYTWVSGQKIVDIQYTDLQRTKPEPIEVVKAYLAKFPSTMTLTDAELKASAHNVQWIKEEMDRRLWLCDKWNAKSQASSITQADLIYNLVRSMNVFLNYRQKYYGESAKSDLEALFGYKQTNDVAAIQKKLTEYKTWWAKHKDKRISLP